MEHRDGPDRTRPTGIGIPREGLLDGPRVDTGAPVPLDRLHLEAEAPGHPRPEAREVAGLVDEHRSPGDRVLTRAASHAPVPEDGKMYTRSRVPSMRRIASRHSHPSARELGATVVDGGPADGLEHPPRHVGGPRDLKEVASGPVAHGLSSNSSDKRRA